ncbi:O-antigen ligase family protein [Fictibacillus nanhaiensis]|uniref:O-antigen ligase family protein n=1 Tax=Fictibacillus nanhaiensis TaxID=742169 RepID=UPI003C13C25E
MIIQNEISVKRNNLFFRLYFLFIIMMVVNFFLTPNPYSALHSGKAGMDYHTVSDNFFIIPAYLVLFSLISLTLYTKRLLLDYKTIIAMTFLLISGLITQELLNSPITYIYNFLSFVLIASIATTSHMSFNNIEIKKLNKIARYLTYFLIIGVILAIVFPNKYGVLPFEFSRYARGEVTFWNITGVYTIYPIIAILLYRKNKTKKYIFLSFLMTIIVLSTATRSLVVLTLLPFAIMFLFYLKPVYKLMFFSFLLPFGLFFHERIFAFFTGANINYSYDITNGRLDLWMYHWRYFKENIFFGNGAFFMDRFGDYYGRADSEIGFLKWFSENGLFFGLILTVIVAKSILIAIKHLSKGRLATDIEVFFSLIVLSMLPNIIQSYSRVINLDDMIFWFSVFFLNAYRKPLLPYIDLFKIK